MTLEKYIFKLNFQLDVNTVAAGGGSMLFFRSGLFQAGPESAGAHPGPACYRKGGPLTVTDANLMLNRIVPDYFPNIFGPDENQSLDKAATMAKFQELRVEINKFHKKEDLPIMSLEEIALGFIKVANEAMCRPIRALTQVGVQSFLEKSLVKQKKWLIIFIFRPKVLTRLVTFWRASEELGLNMLVPLHVPSTLAKF